MALKIAFVRRKGELSFGTDVHQHDFGMADSKKLGLTLLGRCEMKSAACGLGCRAKHTC